MELLYPREFHTGQYSSETDARTDQVHFYFVEEEGKNPLERNEYDNARTKLGDPSTCLCARLDTHLKRCIISLSSAFLDYNRANDQAALLL